MPRTPNAQIDIRHLQAGVDDVYGSFIRDQFNRYITDGTSSHVLKHAGTGEHQNDMSLEFARRAAQCTLTDEEIDRSWSSFSRHLSRLGGLFDEDDMVNAKMKRLIDESKPDMSELITLLRRASGEPRTIPGGKIEIDYKGVIFYCDTTSASDDSPVELCVCCEHAATP